MEYTQNNSVNKIQRVSVTDQVYDVLLKKITDGVWKIGDRIPSEIELSKQLGVSRVTLKFALQKMNTLGITETRVGDGTFVCDLSQRNYFSELFKTHAIDASQKQINEFRVLIEYDSMKLVARNNDLKKSDFNELKKILKKMGDCLKNRNDENYHLLHYDFHHTICNLSGNIFFIQLHDTLKTLFYNTYKSNTENTWDTLGREESIIHHTRIFNSLVNRDLEAISEILDEILQDSILNSD